VRRFIRSKITLKLLKVQVNSTRIIAKNIVNREIDIAVVGGEIPEELRKNLV
jgi:hypothetical protein